MLGVPRSDGKTFFLVFTYIWQEDVAKISKMPKATHNINPARAITGLVMVTIILLYHFSIYRLFISTLPVFTRPNIFEKKNSARKNATIEYEFESRGPGPPGRTCTSTTGYFHDKTKKSQKFFRVS